MSKHDAVDIRHLREAAEIERIAALGWRGLEEERVGDWLLRAGNGFTGRANSALPLGDPGLPLPVALDAVATWYRRRGPRPLFQVPLPLCAGLDAVLEAAGWQAFNYSHVLAGELRPLLDATRARPDLPAATYATEPSPAWLSGYHYRGAALPDGAEKVLPWATVRYLCRSRRRRTCSR